ncbi:DUF6398 domain-containing protein [Humibacillus xanthopallidus]|uniref:DUF6398 domain-containing protein n=1 Tax=Humibacillus xanthopallidus TaxID=412689 RepID=UPI001152006E|nr:DUF6398 domain-containing protein [Humibacillus xanthopallidus]
MSRRAGKRGRGDARLRIVHGGAAQPKRGTTVPGDAIQPMVVDLRRRLRDDNPWSFLAFVSTLVEVAESGPGPADDIPDTGGWPEGGGAAALAPVVESFIGIDLAETTAALNALAVLVRDAEMVGDIDAELAHRRQPMPLWLRDLRDTRVTKAHLMAADGDRGANVVLGLDWSGGHGATFLVYVDHARGTVVRDAFPVPAPIEEVLSRLDDTAGQEGPGAPDFDIEELDLAEARSLVEEALDESDEEDWDPESDTWPASRPILRWLLQTMPEGGLGWAEHEDFEDFEDFDDLDTDSRSVSSRLAEELLSSRRELVDRFAASPEATAAGLDLRPDGTDRMALALTLCASESMNDKAFLKWSPERVELLLFGLLPRTTLVDRTVAKRVPQLLKVFAAWCLAEVGASPKQIAAVRDAVDRSGPDYIAIVTSFEATRLRQAVQDYAALLGDPVGILPVMESQSDFAWAEFMIDRAAEQVGGREALSALDLEPLPDEEFDWSTVPSDIHGPVSETLQPIDELATERFDVEFRTACRRFLAAVVAGDPGLFRRRGSTASAAAAIVWLVGRFNGVVARGGDGMLAGEVWTYFGVTASASSRAQVLRRAVGLDPYALTDSLEHPEWLTSANRQDLARRRDEGLALRAAQP